MRDRGINISETELAIATYIVYTQSRDAMGKYWNSAKFKSTHDYRKKITRLYKCAERMEGVYTYNIDAMDFFRWYLGANRDVNIEDIDKDYAVMLRWIHDPRVMMYLDPSYISPLYEEKLLEGIDWQSADCLSEAIKKKLEEDKARLKKKYEEEEDKHKNIDENIEDKLPGNLGKIYAKSFDYEDQENFLRCIYDAECKIMVSNYDLKLYNKYLTEENGWRRIEFETATSVGGKRENKRLEVLWYNY